MEIKNYVKKYYSMYNFVCSCQYHIIFTPKYRRKVLIDGVDERLKELIFCKQDEYHYKVIELEIMPDRVHLLIDVKPKVNVFTLVSKIKNFTARVLKSEFPWLKSRLPNLWTRSSFISSCGDVTLEVVENYIEDQKGK